MAQGRDRGKPFTSFPNHNVFVLYFNIVIISALVIHIISEKFRHECIPTHELIPRTISCRVRRTKTSRKRTFGVAVKLLCSGQRRRYFTFYLKESTSMAQI